MTQIEFGVALAEFVGYEVPQGTVSRWELGKSDLTLEQVRSIEKCLGLRPGRLLEESNYFA